MRPDQKPLGKGGHSSLVLFSSVLAQGCLHPQAQPVPEQILPGKLIRRLFPCRERKEQAEPYQKSIKVCKNSNSESERNPDHHLGSLIDQFEGTKSRLFTDNRL